MKEGLISLPQKPLSKEKKEEKGEKGEKGEDLHMVAADSSFRGGRASASPAPLGCFIKPIKPHFMSFTCLLNSLLSK